MTRTEAAQLTHELLAKYNLKDWHVRLTTDLTRPWVGKCVYKDKCIYLNAHHVDTHPTPEVENTIRHEVAHALTPGSGHNEVWKSKAREVGCDNTLECMTYGLDERAIDAIRSGQILELSYDEQVIRTPKYKITRIQEKCPTCGKVAEEISSTEMNGKRIIFLKCLHVMYKTIHSGSPFEKIVSNDWKDEVKNCKHNWDGNRCLVCNEFRLFDFQVESCRFLERANGRAGVFHEMGLGKTPISLSWCRLNPKEAFPVLAIVKSGIKYQWAKEMIRWIGIDCVPQVIQSSRDVLLPMKAYIISYDMLVPKVRQRNGKTIVSGFDIEKFKAAGVKTVILDECQQIKNADSSRTQMVRRIVRDIGHVIPLSGTPWKNRGSEYFPVLNMLDPIRFGSNQKFINDWVDTYYDGNKMKVGGIRNPKRFQEFVKDIVIRNERSEVMKQLPIISRNAFYCEMDETTSKAYSKETNDFVKFWNQAVIGGEEDSFETYQNILARITRMRHITGLAKIPNTVEFVKDFLEESEQKKLVVFAHHKDVQQLLFDQITTVCRELDLPAPMKITADMSSEERFATQEEFNRRSIAVMVGSTLASGEGLNLQTCADCVMHERQWNPANEEQAEGRFIRIGQVSNAVIATYMLAEGSIDDLFHGLVERKRAQFHAAMNKGEATAWKESGMIKDLAQAIVNQANGR